MELFTTAEAAAYLRLKERKIYEMVAEGSVPCTKVTGRWLFPKAELDHWLSASVTRPAGMTRRDAAPIVGGSHDPLLEWALRESGSGLATLAVGSEAGLDRFLAGEVGEEAERHLGAAGVVGAQEQYGGFGVGDFAFHACEGDQSLAGKAFGQQR